MNPSSNNPYLPPQTGSERPAVPPNEPPYLWKDVLVIFIVMSTLVALVLLALIL